MKQIKTSSFYFKIVKSIIDFEIERIERLLTQVETQTKKDKRDLNKIFDGISKDKFESDFDYDSYVVSLSDENCFLNNVNALAYQLAIISLYRLVEITSVREVSRFVKNRKKKGII